MLERMGFMARPSPIWTAAKSARPGRRLPGWAIMQRSLSGPNGRSLMTRGPVLWPGGTVG